MAHGYEQVRHSGHGKQRRSRNDGRQHVINLSISKLVLPQPPETDYGCSDMGGLRKTHCSRRCHGDDVPKYKYRIIKQRLTPKEQQDYIRQKIPKNRYSFSTNYTRERQSKCIANVRTIYEECPRRLPAQFEQPVVVPMPVIQYAPHPARARGGALRSPLHIQPLPKQRSPPKRRLPPKQRSPLRQRSPPIRRSSARRQSSPKRGSTLPRPRAKSKALPPPPPPPQKLEPVTDEELSSQPSEEAAKELTPEPSDDPLHFSSPSISPLTFHGNDPLIQASTKRPTTTLPETPHRKTPAAPPPTPPEQEQSDGYTFVYTYEYTYIEDN